MIIIRIIIILMMIYIILYTPPRLLLQLSLRSQLQKCVFTLRNIVNPPGNKLKLYQNVNL